MQFSPARASRSFLSSSIGAKTLMAVSGVVMAGFLVGHLAGNLLVFAGPTAINDYAEWLKGQPLLVWGTRGVLLAAFALHVLTGIRLSGANRSARPVRYAYEKTIQASWASRYMLLTGLVVGVYVLFHLAHFTLGLVQPENYQQSETLMRDGVEVVRHDVRAMMFSGFQTAWVSVLYLAGMVLLGFHLSHGLASLFQTLGLRHPQWTPRIELGARALAWILALGFLSIPLSIWTGLVTP